MKSYLKLLGIAALAAAVFTVDPAMAQKGKKGKKTTAKGKKVTTTTTTTTTAANTASAVAPPKYVYRYIKRDSLDYDSSGYNSLSVVPVHYSDVMFRMRIRRRVPLDEKCNTPFFYAQNEITRYLFEGLMSGKLTAYSPDSLNKVLPLNYIQDLTTWKDELSGDRTAIKAAQFRNLYLFEDLVFDRQRSVTMYDIQYLVLNVPGGVVPGQEYEVPLAAIRYKDAEAYFNSLPSYARWRNPINNKENRTFTEAFRLRLFCGIIQRIDRDNPTDADLAALPENGGRDLETLLNAQRVEGELVSWENQLWEY